MATRKSIKFSTDVHIKNLKPRSKTYERADAIYRGLRIRVSPKGLRTWFYRYRDPLTGRLGKATLGNYPQMSLAMARESCADLRVLRDRGERPQQVIQAERRKRIKAAERATEKAAEDIASVKALAADYLDYASQAKRSWREDRRILERELLPVYGNKRASSIIRADIREVLSRIRDRGAPVQANRTLAAVRKLFNWALESDWPNSKALVHSNPCAGLKVSSEAPRQRALSDAELRKVLRGLPGTDMPEDHRDLVRFILLTGCRITEAVTIEWSDIQGDQWRIPVSKTKDSREHLVFLSPQAQAIIDSRTDGDTSWVWPNPRTKAGHVRADAVQKSLLAAIPNLGVKHFTAHDLRRTLTTWLGDQRADEAIHDRILNHVVGGIRKVCNTSRYNQPAKEWWYRWGQHIAAMEADNVSQIKKRG